MLSFWVQCRHVYIRGVSGTGKTEGLLKNIAYQHLLAGLPFTAIDPVGGFIDENLLGAIGAMNRRLAMREHTRFAALNAHRRRERGQWLSDIHLLNFREADASGWVCNPLCKVPWLSIEEQVDLFLSALVPLAGDFAEQRRMLSVARAALVTLMKLAELDGVGPPTLRDVFDLLVTTDNDIRFFIESLRRRHAQGRFRFAVRSTLIEAYMEHFFAGTSGRERNELVQSFINLLGLVQNDRCARQFLGGSARSNIDFGEVVNSQRGRTLLVLLPDGLHTKTLLGSYITNWIEAAAKKRTPQDVKSGAVPVYSIIADEAHEVFTRQWASTIATARNRGLRLFVAHQSAGQFLGDDGQLLLRTFMDNCATHVFFRVGWTDAREVAGQIFKPDGNRVKRTERHVTDTTSRSAGVSQSVTEQISRAEALMQGSSRTIAIGQNRSASVGEANGISRVETESVSVSWGKGWSRAVSKTSGQSLTLSESASESEGVADGAAQVTGESESNATTTGVFESAGLCVDLDSVGLMGAGQPGAVR